MERRDTLAWAALAAALVVTASAEYDLARAAQFGPWVAAGVPAVLDIYTVRALRSRRDVGVVVLAMVVVQALAHLVAAHMLTVSVPLVVAVSSIAPLVLWRVHRIGHGPAHSPAATIVVDPQGDEGDTLPSLEDTPVSTPEICAPTLVICGDTLPVPDVPPRRRLDTEPARAVIEMAWREGRSIREAARLSTRAPSQVQRVYARLNANSIFDRLDEGRTA